jgi:GxxExxY protein
MVDYPHSELTQRIIGAAIEVHRALGPGLLESAYEACISAELRTLGIAHERQVVVPMAYKGTLIDMAYRIDLLVEDFLIVELKVVESVTAVHEAQLLTYMKLAKKPVGLIINCNTGLLKNGIVG